MISNIVQMSADSDPFWSNVSFLMKFEGPNGSTSFVDLSRNKTPLTSVGGSSISTAEKKFGSSSLLTGPSKYINTNTMTGFNLGSGDFTVESWVYLNSTPATNSYWPVSDCRASATFQRWVWGVFNISGTLRLDFVYGDNTGNRITGTSTSVPIQQWVHLAVTRKNGVMQLFVNGVKDATTLSYSTQINSAGTEVRIGASRDPIYQLGYIDEFRITVGVARYTSNFTVPQTSFPTQ